MVNACECVWTKEQAKALITFLMAERRRHLRDIEHITKSIYRLQRQHRLTKKEMEECEVRSIVFIHF